jgi:transcriptional regulator of acetoin/glycerol metabolism
MPVALQARLLRVLEEREVVPLGSETPIKLDIRLISATHCDLQKKIGLGEFREDLYYRLQGVTLTLPPLRERADRSALIRHLAAEESAEDGPVELDTRLLSLLEQQRWPGNVRQLRHLLRSMIALRETDCLGEHDLPAEYRIDAAAAAPATEPCAPTASESAAGSSLNTLESAERRALLQVLERHEWNLSSVSRELDISRNTLYRKLQRLNIRPPEKSLVH